MSQHASSGAGASSSSHTKYASLPDVDTSAPDVYEYEGTNRAHDAARSGRQRSRKQRSEGNDGACSDSSSDDSDRSADRKHPGDGKGALNEDIDQSSLRRTDAASRFSGATELPAERADFSGRLKTARLRKPKSARPRDAGLETSTYAMDGTAAKERESAVERLRRLKFEASQLEEELNASAGHLKVEATSKDEQVDGSEVLAQLKILQDQLEKLPSPSTSDASVSGEGALTQEAVRRLLQQVKQPAASAAQTAPAETLAAPAASERRTADLVQLEARLSELESTLGLQQALLDESKPLPRPVLPTLSRLEHQLSLLSQPRHLDAISRRVKVLVTEMDRVHDVRRKLTEAAPSTNAETTTSPNASSTLTPAEMTKLQHLFDVSTRLEPLLPVLPSVLDRLQTLSDLHASAAHFGSTLDELEEAREARQQQENELDELLRKMETNMEENRKKVETNLESLQSRIEDVSGRLERVAHG